MSSKDDQSVGEDVCECCLTIFCCPCIVVYQCVRTPKVVESDYTTAKKKDKYQKKEIKEVPLTKGEQKTFEHKKLRELDRRGGPKRFSVVAAKQVTREEIMRKKPRQQEMTAPAQEEMGGQEDDPPPAYLQPYAAQGKAKGGAQQDEWEDDPPPAYIQPYSIAYSSKGKGKGGTVQE